MSWKLLHFHRWAETKGTYRVTYFQLPSTWSCITRLSGTKHSTGSEWFKKVYVCAQYQEFKSCSKEAAFCVKEKHLCCLPPKSLFVWLGACTGCTVASIANCNYDYYDCVMSFPALLIILTCLWRVIWVQTFSSHLNELGSDKFLKF